MFVSLFDLKRQLDRAQQIHPTDFNAEQVVSALRLLLTELESAQRRIEELEKQLAETR